MVQVIMTQVVNGTSGKIGKDSTVSILGCRVVLSVGVEVYRFRNGGLRFGT